jgi:hypothetical protein
VSALTVASYLGSSTRKVLLTAHHLREFKAQFAHLRQTGEFSGTGGPDDPFLPAEAHADGCVLQLFAALEAFSCAAAWHFQLGGRDKDRDEYSFRRLAQAPPVSIATVVGKLASSIRYRELGNQRHRAGHRGLVSQRRSFSRDIGLRLETVDRVAAEEVLDPLFKWGQQAVRLLQGLACLQAWPGSKLEETYLLNRWPPIWVS